MQGSSVGRLARVRIALLAGAVVLGAFLAVCGSSGGSDTVTKGIPAGVLFETPTVPGSSPANGGGADADAAYRESVRGTVIGSIVSLVEAGDYPAIKELLAWTDTTCKPDGSRAGPACSLLGLPEGSRIRTFPLWAGVLIPFPEVSIEAMFELYFSATPRLIAVAEDSNSDRVYLEFAVDPRLTYIDEASGRTTSFLLMVVPAASQPIEFYTEFDGGSLIALARELAETGSSVQLGMTYVSEDAAWLEEAQHELDVICRVGDVGYSDFCKAGVEWPGDTWPSRQ